MPVTNEIKEAEAYNLDNCPGPSKDEDQESKKKHHYAFKEYEQFSLIIDEIPKNVKQMRDREVAYWKFLCICDEYQEQPHLMDPNLPEFFDKLMKLVKSNFDKPENAMIVHESFKYMYLLTKMRGYKKIVQHLTHENCDFEPLLVFLRSQDMTDVYTWQTRYMLLIWLSIVCMVPFDLYKFDLTDATHKETITNRMIEICMPYLFCTDKCQDASAYVLAKFMSRPDLKAVVLPNFFDQLFSYLNENKKSGNFFKLLGILKCIANIFKYCKREEILKYTQPTLKHLIELDLQATNNISLIRKFHVKIIQRIGITFFKFKIAKWRYQRGSRVLMEKINQKAKTSEELVTEAALEEDEEMIPEEVEDIIDQLLNGLKDQETIVRWSAAKGIGRITNRFSKEMAHDVLASVLDLFTFVEDVYAWHGGCLAIAELGRRGLLLPDQLKIVVPIIVNALVFDKKIGNFSFGRNVRDSANYVCWSLARAFEPEVLAPYVNQIASTLLIVTVFDREVNCRRGASAAFQENVGRQGQFPHGIDILTKCDYFAVGQLQNCYLHLSKFIASFDEYRQTLIDHLLEHKFNHWDQAIRELSSKTLYNLTDACPDYMAYSILPKLLKHSFSIDLNTRHGALLSMGEIIHALCEHVRETQQPFSKYFPNNIMTDLKDVISKIFDSKYFRGSGGEYMRPAVCFFIKKLSLAKLFDQNENSLDEKFVRECEAFIRECIEYNKEDIQGAACKTLPYYCDFKFPDKSNLNKTEAQRLIRTYTHCMKSTSKEYVRSGYCMAMGNIPFYLFRALDDFTEVCRSLIQGSKTISGAISEHPVEKRFEKLKSLNELGGWVQARRDSINALSDLFKLIKNKEDFSLLNLTPETLLEIFDCFLHGLSDYSIDSKGDSGSQVREASVRALEYVLLLCAEHKIDSVTKNEALLTKIIGGIIQQAVERIDRTRSIAGRTLANILHNENLELEFLPYSSTLYRVFSKQKCSQIDWNLAHVTLPLFVSLLILKEFRLHLLTGVIYSIGSLTESLVKPAIKTVLKEFKDLKAKHSQDFKEIMEIILNLCQNHLKNDRLAASLIKTVDLTIQNDLLAGDELMEAHIPVHFLDAFLVNVKITKDMTKLNAYIDLFCDILQFEEDRIRERAMIQLMIMLCHQFPRVRKIVAGKVFESLINYTDELFDNDEDYEECVQLLTETNWDQSLDIIKPIRNRICDLTKTPKPVIVPKSIATTEPTPSS